MNLANPDQNTPEQAPDTEESSLCLERRTAPVEPWPKPVDGALLLEQLRQVLTEYVVLPRWASECLPLWVLHTYAFRLREVTTYIGIESPEKRCGKTTLLSVLSALVDRPEVAANISSPAFFRVIEETRPTLIIDEADGVLRGNDQLRGILNSGYSRSTAYVVRVAPQEAASKDQPADAKASRLVRFSCWCPKLMATIGHLPDTLGDRCILIRMQRKTVKEQCARLRNLAPAPLRRQCLRFVQDHAPEIASALPALPAGLHDRAADIWEPLLALADLAGGVWPGWARDAAIGLTLAAQDSNPIGSLFLDIYVCFIRRKVDRIFSRDLVDNLNADPARPWSELRNGRPLTELWVAQQLRPYGVSPRTVRIGGQRAKGYFQEDLMPLFRRYIPRSEIDSFLAEAQETVAESQAAAGAEPPAQEGSTDPPPIPAKSRPDEE